MSKKAFIFPGQGAQVPGMGKDFYDTFSAARETFEEAEDILSQKMTKLIFQGSPEELTLTKNAQLAIYIVSMAMLRTLFSQFPELKPSVCAGLSLGEYTALTAAGKISFQEALPLVKIRGECMQEACVSHPGTLQVVLGMEESAIAEVIQGNAWIANLNCPGQVVIAGTFQGIEKAAADLKAKGAKRVLPLDVSGAFHSPLMLEARKKLEPKIQETQLFESSTDIVMNVPGGLVQAAEEIRKCMIEQVTSPVRWEKGIRSMEGIEAFFEIGPGKTLAGMNKRIGTEAPTISIEKVADLENIICNS